MTAPITDPFTHYFTFDLGDVFVTGKVEFDQDNKMTFQVIKISTPMDDEAMHMFIDWLDFLRKVFEKYKKIKRIGVMELEFAKESLESVVKKETEVKPK